MNMRMRTALAAIAGQFNLNGIVARRGGRELIVVNADFATNTQPYTVSALRRGDTEGHS